MYYRAAWQGGEQPEQEVWLEVVDVPEVSPPKRLIAGLHMLPERTPGLDVLEVWPELAGDLRRFGLNAVELFGLGNVSDPESVAGWQRGREPGRTPGECGPPSRGLCRSLSPWIRDRAPRRNGTATVPRRSRGGRESTVRPAAWTVAPNRPVQSRRSGEGVRG